MSDNMTTDDSSTGNKVVADAVPEAREQYSEEIARLNSKFGGGTVTTQFRNENGNKYGPYGYHVAPPSEDREWTYLGPVDQGSGGSGSVSSSSETESSAEMKYTKFTEDGSINKEIDTEIDAQRDNHEVQISINNEKIDENMTVKFESRDDDYVSAYIGDDLIHIHETDNGVEIDASYHVEVDGAYPNLSVSGEASDKILSARDSVIDEVQSSKKSTDEVDIPDFALTAKEVSSRVGDRKKEETVLDIDSDEYQDWIDAVENVSSLHNVYTTIDDGYIIAPDGVEEGDEMSFNEFIDQTYSVGAGEVSDALGEIKEERKQQREEQRKQDKACERAKEMVVNDVSSSEGRAGAVVTFEDEEHGERVYKLRNVFDGGFSVIRVDSDEDALDIDRRAIKQAEPIPTSIVMDRNRNITPNTSADGESKQELAESYFTQQRYDHVFEVGELDSGSDWVKQVDKYDPDSKYKFEGSFIDDDVVGADDGETKYYQTENGFYRLSGGELENVDKSEVKSELGVETKVEESESTNDSGTDSGESDSKTGKITVKDEVPTQYGHKAVLDTPYEAKEDIKDMDWDKTHYEFENKSAFQGWLVDVDSLDYVKEHLQDAGWNVEL